ncbi:MAG: alpha/beta hydrolase [Alphaproteobacteria bacterium]|nr:alpha/beta hydrolase [Alphaproteobacteria bacterium]
MKSLSFFLALLLGLSAHVALADDQTVTSAQPFDGEALRYVLTTGGPQPKYAVILMPGGNGRLALPAKDGPVGPKLSDNFLIRSRTLFADQQFVAASTSATSTPGRIMAIVADLERRYGKLQVYVVGTSRSTEATISLAKTLDGQVAGFVHTSSMNAIAGLDTRGSKSRNLIVAHQQDACRVTRPSNATANNKSFGTPLILVEGGRTQGDDCEAWAYHGYNGIERETVDKIKAWILAGK